MSTLKVAKVESPDTSTGGIAIDSAGDVQVATNFEVATIKDTSGSNSSTPAQISQGRAKAWVNFNGNTNTTRSSYNVSSVTDNGTGDYTVNFTNGMSGTDYCIQVSATDDGSGSGQADNYAYGSWLRGANSTAMTASSARIRLGYPASTSLSDQSHVMITIFDS